MHVEREGPRHWLRPARGWELDGVYRVGVTLDMTAIPSLCRDFGVEPFWTEFGVRASPPDAAPPGGSARP